MTLAILTAAIMCCMVASDRAQTTTQRAAIGYDLSWYTIDGGGDTTVTGVGYEFGGTIGQSDAGVGSGGAYSLYGGFWIGAAETPLCSDTPDCADIAGPGLCPDASPCTVGGVGACGGMANQCRGHRDDNCVHWTCGWGECSFIDIPFGDIGQPAATLTIADCEPDFTADGSDGFHALNCFSNTFFGVPMTPYLCDDSNAPMNADVGGAGLTCCPDGACDASDRFLALAAFSAGGGPAGPNGCVCPTNPISPGHSCPPPNLTAPPARIYEPTFVGSTTLSAVASQGTAKAGDLVSVDVFIDNAVNLQGYQLHLGATGGRSGSLELVDVSIADRRDHIYAGQAFWDAFNVSTRQMMAGMDSGATAVKAGGYLATFTYRVSPDASGTFVVDVLEHATGRTDNRSMLFGPVMQGMIKINGSKPAVIDVASGRPRSVR